MNGICGLILQGNAGSAQGPWLTPMLSQLASEGEQCESLFRKSIALGTSGKPWTLSGVREIRVNSRDVQLAISGNIYNLQELLKSHDYTGDSLNGLLRLYVKNGIAFIGELRGDYAIAIRDERDDCAYLITDRFRVNPLFYWSGPNGLVFSSRLQGIRACPLVGALAIDPRSLLDVTALSCVPTPRTIYQDCHKLPPGCLLTFRNGDIDVGPYWDMSFQDVDTRDEVCLSRDLQTLLYESVDIRLKTDWPEHTVGAFLSGGIDSSTITGLMSQITKTPILCFSIGFEEEQFNELDYAQIAARHFNAKHIQYCVTPADAVAAIPIILEAFDEPFGNASAIPTLYCAKVAKQHGVDVLYAGDGGDELFAGNERYGYQRLFEYYERIPRRFRESIFKPSVHFLASTIPFGVFVKADKYIKRASIPYAQRISSYEFFQEVNVRDFFTHDLLHAVGCDPAPYSIIEHLYYNAPARAELDKQLYIDLKFAIGDNDLFKVTRMVDLAGVGVRFPFLDHRLAEFAGRVPASVKMRGTELRSFFKKSYAGFLPPAILKKKKHGFGLPIPVWLRTDKQLNDMLHDLVLGSRSLQRGYFQRQAVEKLVNVHKTDQTSSSGTILWRLMNLELWQRRFCDHPD